jgi:hypothetical protein
MVRATAITPEPIAARYFSQKARDSNLGFAEVDIRFRTPIVQDHDYCPSVDMLTGDKIAEADLTDLRKLGQGRHASI